MEFPLFSTKTQEGRVFDLTDAPARKEYFEYKAGPEIRKLQEYLKEKTFILYLLGKKNSGKGTYAKMLQEVVAPDKIEHISVGDLIRSFDAVLADAQEKRQLVSFLEKKYRGPMPLPELIRAMEERSTKVLLPSELILALVERKITQLGRKAIVVDGFPRDVDQVNYSLFFKNLIDYRNDPDIFVCIDVPTTVIDERIKNRVVCPLCNTSRSIKLLPTKGVVLDKEKQEFYLLCDNPACSGARMGTKEGDQYGIEPIRDRLERDGRLMEQVARTHGIIKIMLRNCIPKEKAGELVDDYEITPEYRYSVDAAGQVLTHAKPWEVLDDDGVPSNSLMPPPVLVALIKGLVGALGL